MGELDFRLVGYSNITIYGSKVNLRISKGPIDCIAITGDGNRPYYAFGSVFVNGFAGTIALPETGLERIVIDGQQVTGQVAWPGEINAHNVIVTIHRPLSVRAESSFGVVSAKGMTKGATPEDPDFYRKLGIRSVGDLRISGQNTVTFKYRPSG